jgi:hypothetical protein
MLPELHQQGLQQGIGLGLLVLGISGGNQGESLLNELLGQGEGGAGWCRHNLGAGLGFGGVLHMQHPLPCG